MTSAAVVAAVAAIERDQSEEESMTSYSPSDLAENWEFKIVRAVNGKFRDPAFFAQTLAEEARSGWQLVEKFDNGRMRLKRPASQRSHDAGRNIDPYRINVGPGQGHVALVILAVTIVVAFLILGLVIYLAPK